LASIEKALTVYETYLRSERGAKVTENVWDNKIVPNAALALKEKYDISFGDEFIPTDPDLKKRLFQAGMEMLVSVGIYNVDTERIIRVTEDEVRAGIRAAPKRVQLGEYGDKVMIEPRKGNSSKKPVIQGGPTGATVSEDMFIPMIQSYAQEPIVDTIVNGVMATVGGVSSTTNTPFEIMGTLAEIRAVREACVRAGRPYMAI
jgi:methylamine--corrinoid protein Co-methyltransferase